MIKKFKILRLFRANRLCCTRDYYYKELLNKYENLESYLSIIDFNNKQALLTDKSISFSNDQMFKENEMKYLKMKYGKPNYIIVNNYAFGKIKVYLYRIQLGTHKVKMMLHVFHNVLFMYNYTFSYLKNESEKIDILNLLEKKYLIDKGNYTVNNNSYIMDKKKSAIVFSENIDLTINYIPNIDFNLYHLMNDSLKEEIEKNKQIANQNRQEIDKRL